MSTPPGGEAGTNPRPAGEATGRAGAIQLKDLIPLAAFPVTLATALLAAKNPVGVLVTASTVMCAVMAVVAWASRRRGLRWASGITSVALAVTAVVSAIVVASEHGTSPPEGGTVAPPASSTTVKVQPPSALRPPSTGASQASTAGPASDSRCVRSFQSAPCRETGTMVQVSAEPCSPSALLRRWGLRPDLDALLVTTVSHNGSCYVGASPPAASAVTGNDLLRLADDQRVAPQLRACFLDATHPIPCSTRHTGEFVGDWQEDDGSGHVAECEDAAVRYIGRTIELDSPIQSVVLGGPAGYRCAVTSTTALTGTVRQLGGADLPTDDAG